MRGVVKRENLNIILFMLFNAKLNYPRNYLRLLFMRNLILFYYHIEL